MKALGTDVEELSVTSSYSLCALSDFFFAQVDLKLIKSNPICRLGIK